MSEHDRMTITQAAVDRLADCEDPRFKEVMSSLIRHLHGFVRDVKLTQDEWLAAIRFLTETGKTCTDRRQEFILLSDTLGVSMLVVMLAEGAASREPNPAAPVTEATVMGPFFREGAPSLPLGSDISDGVAGEPALYMGRITDPEGKPIANAILDVWSSDGAGQYDVQMPGAGEMKARARFTSDGEGRYRFWSIRPSHYPIPTDGPVGAMLTRMGRHPFRPAHMHMVVHAKGFVPLTTHVFASDSLYLDSDAVFGVRKSLVGNFEARGPGTAPDGRAMSSRYYTMTFDLRLAPG
jgi:hydroxyquinol 1,2-dioxygenase